MDWDISPRRVAWWPRCGSPMLCSDGPPLLDGCRWLSLVRFPVVACIEEPWVCLSFLLSLLLLSLALLLLVRPAAYPTCFCLLPRMTSCAHGAKAKSKSNIERVCIKICGHRRKHIKISTD